MTNTHNGPRTPLSRAVAVPGNLWLGTRSLETYDAGSQGQARYPVGPAADEPTFDPNASDPAPYFCSPRRCCPVPTNDDPSRISFIRPSCPSAPLPESIRAYRCTAAGMPQLEPCFVPPMGSAANAHRSSWISLASLYNSFRVATTADVLLSPLGGDGFKQRPLGVPWRQPGGPLSWIFLALSLDDLCERIQNNSDLRQRKDRSTILAPHLDHLIIPPATSQGKRNAPENARFVGFIACPDCAASQGRRGRFPEPRKPWH